jgi:hypothetical protein
MKQGRSNDLLHLFLINHKRKRKKEKNRGVKERDREIDSNQGE